MSMKNIKVVQPQPSIFRRQPLTDTFNYIENEDDTYEDIYKINILTAISEYIINKLSLSIFI